jgi:alpha-beta hydrolase superfamily lysophospholipase
MFKVLRLIVLIYGLLCGLFWAYQHLFFFQPKALAVNHAFTFPAHTKFTESKIPFDSSTVIDVVKFLPTDSLAKGVVLFFHGNRFNVEHYSQYAPYFTNNGYECWMPDYPGYGRSTGELSIEGLQELAVQLYKMARAKYPPENIIIYGKSLGTGIASYLASGNKCAKVVLETPYYSISSLAENYLFFLPTQWLTRYNLQTNIYFEKIDAPITVMHGTKDEIISFENACALLKYMKRNDAFYVFDGGKHNTLPENKLYKHVLDSVMTP